MARSGITIDTSEFNRAIRQFSAVTKKDAEKVLRGEMRLLVQRLVQVTPPAFGKGSSKAAQRLGEAAVEGDIRKVFFPVKGRVPIVTALHEQARDARGRVRRGVEKHPVNARLLREYIRRKKAHVGRAKAGWMFAANVMRVPGMPAWVRRHGSGDGSFTDALRNGKGFIEATNRNKAIGNLNQEARILEFAFRGRLRDLRKKIEDAMAHNARKISARRAP